MVKKYWLPLTYPPKIHGVRTGTITQTIREKQKRDYKVNDLVAFHGWSGKPYYSPWSFRTDYWPLNEVIDIVAYDIGISPDVRDECVPWMFYGSLAERDGIVPATGEELKKVLFGMHKIPEIGLPFQILRWDPSYRVVA